MKGGLCMRNSHAFSHTEIYTLYLDIIHEETSSSLKFLC